MELQCPSVSQNVMSADDTLSGSLVDAAMVSTNWGEAMNTTC